MRKGWFFVLELNRLYHQDCMIGMAEFPDGYFDLALVDPPYGIKIDEKMSKQKPRGGVIKAGVRHAYI